MEFGFGTFALAYLAGLLSTLAPCVLPLVPIVLATAVAAHRLGPLALAAGLMLSFATVGIFIATIGVALGLDADVFRIAAALLLVAAGSVLMSSTLQLRFATVTAGISVAGNALLSKLDIDGLRGQFVVGLVLGMVWSPCIGPTLGAATALASQGQDLAQVAMLMALFGLGASTPLILLGALSRTAMMKARDKLMSTGKFGKLAFGAVVFTLGMTILTGLDKRLEMLMVEHAPNWIVELTTRY